MSLASLRDGSLSVRRSDRAASLRKRTAKLRALNAITATITQHCGLAPSLDTNFDAIPSPPPTPSEARFLDENDLEKGRYFQDASLPATLEAIASISPFKSPASQESRDETAAANTSFNQFTSRTATTGVQGADRVKTSPESAKKAQLNNNSAATLPKRAEGGPVKLSDVVKQHPDHHAKTVHLPPKEVQEERMRARRQSRDELRAAQLREAEAHPGESASSPSSTVGASTVGAWSASTPVPADPSPATSVGEEVAEKLVEDAPIIPVNDTMQKQEHDKLLDVQKELARREILGPDVASPDVQLRLEQEQAVKASRDAAAAAPSAAAAAAQLQHGAANDIIAEQKSGASAAAIVPSAQTPQEELPRDSARVSMSNSTKATSPAANGSISNASRMTTRVSSGTLRQKSVSEIIGEPSKTSTSVIKRHSAADIASSIDSSKASATVGGTTRQDRARLEPASEERSSQSKRHSGVPISCEGYEALRGAADDPLKDYLEPLFRMQTHDNLPINKTLAELVTRANKVVSTADQFAGIHERQDHRMLRRIYALQNANKWSLRQMQPCAEPEPPKTHMDFMLSEMKWMRTDFRQERKNKKQLAKFYAEECAEWVNSDAQTRLSKQITVRVLESFKPTSNALHSPADTNFETGESNSQDAPSPPELDATYENDDSSMADMDEPRTPPYYVAPSSIFPAMNIGKENVHLMDSDHLLGTLNELPLYTAFDDDLFAPENITQRQVPSVSRFCEEKMMIKIPQPIKKRSRFDYEEDDEGQLASQMPATKRLRAKDGAGNPPEQTDVALFDPENKLLRDRLHSNTAFRPPSEFPMPSSQFYEFRTSSQWIAEDDQLLRRLARDYSFNWSLIADEMSLPSNMAGAPDRRTPWECFERWVELESLPNEMKKTIYFKTWNQRLETAQRNNDARYQAQLAHQTQNPNQPQNIQRRRTQPLRVEKRRTSRYLHVVDAMRKNARKREQHAHKQAEAQKAASLRKQHESSAPKSAMHSPAEFSRLRHERDVQYAQRQEQYRQQMLERQRQAAIQQRTGQFAGQQAHSNANQQRPANGAQQMQPGQPQQAVNNNQMQSTQQGQAPRGGSAHLAVPQMGMQGNIPQAQMAPNMRAATNGQGNHSSTDNMQQQRLALEQARHQAQLKQQAQMNGNGQQFPMGPPNRISPGGAHAPNGMMNGQQNPAMMAAMQQSNNSHGSTPNGALQQNYNSHSNSAAASASPHMPPPPNPAVQQAQSQQQTQQPQQLSSGHIPAIAQITHQLQAKHPNATPEQIKELTSQHLKQFYSNQQNQQARQSALQAAAGTHAVPQSPNNQPIYNPNHNQGQNQAAFQQNNNVTANGHTGNNMQANGHPPYSNGPSNGVNQSPSGQNQYAAAMRQQLIQQRQSQIQSAAVQAANGSPRVAQASPNVAHASPNMGQAVPNMNGVPNRTPTPQMARLGSSGGPQGQGTLQSPNMAQGSPRAVPAGVAQRQ